jgi:hypothetical protein
MRTTRNVTTFSFKSSLHNSDLGARGILLRLVMSKAARMRRLQPWELLAPTTTQYPRMLGVSE